MAVLAVLALPGAVRAQPAGTVALVDFADESSEGRMIGAEAFTTPTLVHFLSRRRPDLATVAGGPVRTWLQSRGWAPTGFLSTGRAAELGAALGATLVVTGRWVTLDLVTMPDEPPAPGQPVRGETLGRAAAEIRVVDVRTRRVVHEEVLRSQVLGLAGRQALLVAAQNVLREAAERLSRL
jgi:hypothetical protein